MRANFPPRNCQDHSLESVKSTRGNTAPGMPLTGAGLIPNPTLPLNFLWLELGYILHVSRASPRVTFLDGAIRLLGRSMPRRYNISPRFAQPCCRPLRT
jgi:hypothetical protein